jgi:DNA-directed RNA polymerase specialized sigma24 family protein
MCASGARTAVNDEEDVASAVFARLVTRTRAGVFPRLEDRDDLWRILARLTADVVVEGVRWDRRAKRGAGRELPAADVPPSDEASTVSDLFGNLVGRTPAPEQAALLAEAFESRIAALPDPRLREIARLKFEGYTNEEVAGRIGRSLRSVVGGLTLIRKRLEEAGDFR